MWSQAIAQIWHRWMTLPQCKALSSWPFNFYFTFPRSQKHLIRITLLILSTTSLLFMVGSSKYVVCRLLEICFETPNKGGEFEGSITVWELARKRKLIWEEGNRDAGRDQEHPVRLEQEMGERLSLYQFCKAIIRFSECLQHSIQS